MRGWKGKERWARLREVITGVPLYKKKRKWVQLTPGLHILSALIPGTAHVQLTMPHVHELRHLYMGIRPVG